MFFILFLVTTAVMSINATEDVRRQRGKILPVSLSSYGFEGRMPFLKGGSATAFYMNIATRQTYSKETGLSIAFVVSRRWRDRKDKRIDMLPPLPLIRLAIALVLAYTGATTIIVISMIPSILSSLTVAVGITLGFIVNASLGADIFM